MFGVLSNIKVLIPKIQLKINQEKKTTATIKIKLRHSHVYDFLSPYWYVHFFYQSLREF